MHWNHILDKQPENNMMIVQIDPPYNGHYAISTRIYVQNCDWEEYLLWAKELNIVPDFWWVYEEDFPFPGREL